MKLNLQYFASAPIETTVSKEYTKDSTTELVTKVKVIVTPVPTESVAASELENNYQVSLEGWTKCNDGKGSYYKEYSSNTTETLTFQWYHLTETNSHLDCDVDIEVKEIGAFVYIKTNWVNDETPITADNLNNMEKGIKYLSENGSGTSVLNSKSTSTSATYSCDYINNEYEWKLAGTVASNNQMTLPTSFNELYIEVTVSGVYFTCIIPRNTLSDTTKRYRMGFHGYSGNGAGIGIDVSTSSAQLIECAVDNEYKMASASTTIYYR